MKISYAILTHNEGNYIKNLLLFLIQNKRENDEIVVLDDFSDDILTVSVFKEYESQIQIHYRTFDGDHTQKNHLNSLCSGDYILQLDADEIVTDEFIIQLPSILEANDKIELFIMPRINTVTGLTNDWIQKWNWTVNDKGWVNFPDYQMRLYKNDEKIKWSGLLHSRIEGHQSYVLLPEQETFCITHLKQLDRQIEQNNLYDRIDANGRTKYKV